MIPIEILQSVRTIITHKDCPDGIASAILLHDAIPDAEVKFLSHGEKAYAELVPSGNGRDLFCDIAPPESQAPLFEAAGAIVLDHHKGSENLIKTFFSERNYVFADEKSAPGVSGAVLAFREVWAPFEEHRKVHRGGTTHRYHRAKDFAQLAGIRDTWQTLDSRFQLASEQAEALRFWPVTHWLGILDPFDGTEMNVMLNIGSVLWEKKLEAAKRTEEGAWFVKSNGGTRCVLFEGTAMTSDVAERIGKEADLIIGFGLSVEPHGRHLLHVSLRSRTDFDCVAFAKMMGGGGHTRAAGFTHAFRWDAIPNGFPNPYFAILAFLISFEEK
jgi:hypothetical protein